MNRSLITIALVGISLSPHAHAKSPEPPVKKSSTALVIPIPSGSFTSLVATKTDSVGGKFSLPAITGIDPDDKVELSRISAICNSDFGGNDGRPESALVGIFGALIKPLFGFLFHKADKAIDAKLEGYKSEWSAGMTASLFERTGNGHIQPSYRCMRLLRVREIPDQPNDVAEIDFDALFAVHWIPASSAWQLVPLRVFTRNPVARGDDVKFAASIAGTSAVVKDGLGETQMIPETVILKGAYDVASDAFPTNGKPKAAYPVKVCDFVSNNLALPDVEIAGKKQIHPLRASCNSDEKPNSSPQLVESVAALAIPGNLPSDAVMQNGSASTFVIKVAEAGDGKRKARLEDWKVFLSKAGDGLSDAMTTALSDLISGKKDD